MTAAVAPDMGYVDQSPDALLLSLVPGDIDKQQLTVLDTLGVSLAGGELEVAIIGASHYAQWRDADRQVHLTELFACTQPDESGPTFHAREDHGVLTHRMGDVDHEISIETTTGTRAAQRHARFMERVSETSKRQHTLARRFPGMATPFTPLTAVIVEADSYTASIWTLHAYPNVNACVLSASTFHLPAPRTAHV